LTLSDAFNLHLDKGESCWSILVNNIAAGISWLRDKENA
jgi:hypothetical protein